MKKVIILLSAIAMLSSCSTMKRTYIRDYANQMELIKTNFPEVYELYHRGEVVIDNLYTYEKDGGERVGINYHYR